MTNEQQNPLPAEWQREVDDHLDRIEAALTSSNVSRSDRRAIVGDIESQIMEMIAQSREEIVDLDALKGLLNSLDGPEKYGAAPEDSPRAWSDRMRRLWPSRATRFVATGMTLANLALAVCALAFSGLVVAVLCVVGFLYLNRQLLGRLRVIAASGRSLRSRLAELLAENHATRPVPS